MNTEDYALTRILDVKNVCVTFGNKKVLNDVSFSMEEGQYLALVGTNGAGKSTLVRCIIRDYTKYEGHIEKENRLAIGYVSQQNNDITYFPATAYEIIKSGICNQHRFSFMSPQARAFVSSQKFLILDEPTAGLDAFATDKLYESVLLLNKKYRTTIIMVSHDLERVVHEADSVLCLEHSVKFYGRTDEFTKSDFYLDLRHHFE